MRASPLAISVLTMTFVAGLGALAGSSPAPAQNGASPAPAPEALTLEQARAVIEGGLAEAQRLGAPGGAIAVVDAGGYLIALVRPDGTFPAAPQVATAKARTAAIFRKPTQAFENAIREGRNSLTAVEGMTPLEGGVPIVIDGRVVGAVGVSGAASSRQDVEIATYAAAALGG